MDEKGSAEKGSAEKGSAEKGSDPIFPEKGSDPFFARLRWRCRRGMRELDRILEGFLDAGYGALSAAERRRFAEILEFPDPDLHAYLVGRAEPADPELARLLQSIREARAA